MSIAECEVEHLRVAVESSTELQPTVGRVAAVRVGNPTSVAGEVGRGQSHAVGVFGTGRFHGPVSAAKRRTGVDIAIPHGVDEHHGARRRGDRCDTGRLGADITRGGVVDPGGEEDVVDTGIGALAPGIVVVGAGGREGRIRDGIMREFAVFVMRIARAAEDPLFRRSPGYTS
jgi:hypothetical protein